MLVSGTHTQLKQHAVLQEAAQGRTRGEAQARALAVETESLKAEASQLAAELFQERERLAELAAERDSNRLEASRLRSQVSTSSLQIC